MVRPELRDQAAPLRARTVRLVLTDCDGVLTDAGVYYSASGEELRRFSVRDGMGVERLRELAGIPTCIISRENSPVIARRAQKIGADVRLGVHNKLAVAVDVAAALGLALREVAYIGDDVNDLQLLAAAGVSACPADAEPEVRGRVNLVCSRRGGDGAFRELAEFVLRESRSGGLANPDTKEMLGAVPTRSY